MEYNAQEQALIRNFYQNYNWQRSDLENLTGWYRDKIKSDVILAMALQCRISKITAKDVVGKLGHPDFVLGNALNGVILFNMKTRRDVCPTGKYVAIVFLEKGLVKTIGTNRIDLIFYKSAAVKSGKLFRAFRRD